MIPNTQTGIVAHYRTKTPRGPKFTTRQVAAFASDGTALVVGDEGLVPASQVNGFQRVEELEPTQIVALTPAGGWRVHHSVGASWPLVGWALRADGQVVPVVANSDGTVEQLSRDVHGDFNVYHPDAEGAWKPN